MSCILVDNYVLTLSSLERTTGGDAGSPSRPDDAVQEMVDLTASPPPAGNEKLVRC